MEGKTFTGPSPPYEANPSHPPPQGPLHTGSYDTSPPVSYSAQGPVPSHSPPPANHSPTPYPHPPIAPLDSQTQNYANQPQNYANHPPPGSPPPQIAHASPPPAHAAPPITHVQPTPAMSSPGQEKQEYYHVNAGVPQQAGIPMQNHPGMPTPQPSGQYLAPTASVYHTVTPLHALHEGPAPVDCPVCHTRAMTRTEKHAGNTVHAWAAVLCFCLCLGCIPYLVTSLKDTEHFCGHCGVMLATYKNSGHTVVHQHG